MSAHSPVGVFDAAPPRREIPRSIGGSALFWSVKRGLDIVTSVMLLPALAVFALALLVLNRKFNHGPLFYRQTRMGRGLKPFTAVKFRTMQPTREITRRVDDPVEAERITTLGRVLRRCRIDELPQILNVLGGEMSLIGPRPDYFDHACEYIAQIPEYRDRHVVRPGISGLAQVTLGYAEGFDATRAKANADLAYIRNASFGLEARVFWMTLVTVLLGRGA